MAINEVDFIKHLFFSEFSWHIFKVYTRQKYTNCGSKPGRASVIFFLLSTFKSISLKFAGLYVCRGQFGFFISPSFIKLCFSYQKYINFPTKHNHTDSYVYWTVHHLTSWINWTNLMSLFEGFLLLNMFRVLLHSASGADDCLWVYCSVSVCTGVLVRFGWSRVVSECRLEHNHRDFGY